MTTPQRARHAATYARTIKGQFAAGRKQRLNGREWALSFAEFFALRSGPCSYCGGPLSPTGCGLDRLDNARGYVLGNVVPCCNDCNRARSDEFTPAEMRIIGEAIRSVRAARAASP